MATYSDSFGFEKGVAAIPAIGVTRASIATIKLDFARIAAARAAANVPALAVGDTLEVLPIPKNTLVRNVALVVTTTDAVGQISIGDGTDLAGYLPPQSLASVGVFGGVPGIAAPIAGGGYAPLLSGGKVYLAEDTIDITIHAAVPTTAVVHIIAEFVNIDV